MKTLSVSVLAQQDLLEIYTYLAANNAESALRLMRTFQQKFELLAAFPNLGRERPELVIHMRSFPAGNYVIFYQVFDEILEIVRVRHAATDIADLFETP